MGNNGLTSEQNGTNAVRPLQCFNLHISFHSLGDDYRPVQLRKIVLGYPCSAKQSDFKFDLALNYKLSNIIQTYSENKPTLIVSLDLFVFMPTIAPSSMK